MTFKSFYESMNYTDEMKDWFEQRTKKHIGRVQKYAKKIEDYDKRYEGLSKQTEEHDKSKLEDDVEKIPYIFISWDYHCKDLGKDYTMPDGVKDKCNEATLHHVKVNKHHPECWAGDTANINTKDRDAVPDQLVDATKMPDIYVAEMMADWLAMSEEKGSSVKDWADKNVNKRWKFTDEQKDIIYNLINAIPVETEQDERFDNR